MKIKVARDKAELALAGIGIYNAGRAVLSQYQMWRYDRGYVVAIGSNDDAFVAVSTAILRLLPSENRRRLRAYTERRHRGPSEVVALYEATKPETISIKGYKVRVSVETPPAFGGAGTSPEMQAIANSIKPDRLILWASNGAARDAILEFIRDAVIESEKSKTGPRLWLSSRWGDWADHADVMSRPLSTVVLPGSTRDQLVSDIELFLQREAEYVRLGIPWHRGYLLYGPPGTGKTSAVRAIASHLGLDLYCIPLGDLQGDAQLSNLLRSVQPRSALLLEDIDTAVAARDRDADASGVSTSGLLNALDGVGTPHGLVTFMTTNRRKTIDSAILRPGRCDRHFKLGYLDDDQLARLVQVLIGYVPDLPPVPPKTTPSVVVELATQHLDDPEAFLVALKERLS